LCMDHKLMQLGRLASILKLGPKISEEAVAEASEATGTVYA